MQSSKFWLACCCYCCECTTNAIYITTGLRARNAKRKHYYSIYRLHSVSCCVAFERVDRQLLSQSFSWAHVNVPVATPRMLWVYDHTCSYSRNPTELSAPIFEKAILEKIYNIRCNSLVLTFELIFDGSKIGGKIWSHCLMIVCELKT